MDHGGLEARIITMEYFVEKGRYPLTSITQHGQSPLLVNAAHANWNSGVISVTIE